MTPYIGYYYNPYWGSWWWNDGGSFSNAATFYLLSGIENYGMLGMIWISAALYLIVIVSILIKVVKRKRIQQRSAIYDGITSKLTLSLFKQSKPVHSRQHGSRYGDCFQRGCSTSSMSVNSVEMRLTIQTSIICCYESFACLYWQFIDNLSTLNYYSGLCSTTIWIIFSGINPIIYLIFNKYDFVSFH